jgi:chorismate synthase
MSGSTFGKIFRATTFGESHGVALGVVIDGVPAGTKIDLAKIQERLDRRRPGAKADGKFNAAVTARSEADKAEILSGVFEGKAQGTPIAIEIRNTSQHSSDYSNLKDTFRPGHADFTYQEKYGFRDYRGGGRASGRETCARVAAGAVALQFLEQSLGKKFSVTAYTLRAAGISCKKIDLKAIERNPMRAADLDAARAMQERVEELRAKGDSAGGVIECQIKGVPAGLGEPVFEKLDASLAAAMLSIGAVKGIEFGAGFAAADLTGSQNNDEIHAKGSKAAFRTNNAGGLLGGISNGDTIVFRIAIKPVPSVFVEQETVKMSKGKLARTKLKIQGRHDVCLCPRIVPVVEAMAALAIADALLQNKSARL